MNKQKIIKQLKRLADRNELLGARWYLAALKSQGKVVMSYLAENGIGLTIQNLEKLLSPDPIKLATIRFYMQFSGDSAKWQYRFLRENAPNKSIGGDISKIFTSWVRSIQLYVYGQLGGLVTEINETTQRRILDALVQARDNGLGADKAADLIVRETEGQIAKSRALVIARTEGTRAASYGHKIASDSWAQETGQRQYKQWIPIVDNRTRRDHLEMDSQPPIQTELKFNVGGNPMDAPGDPNAPAKETVNCRCRAVYLSERMVMKM